MAGRECGLGWELEEIWKETPVACGEVLSGPFVEEVRQTRISVNLRHRDNSEAD
jgi:hypothetical protein